MVSDKRGIVLDKRGIVFYGASIVLLVVKLSLAL